MRSGLARPLVKMAEARGRRAVDLFDELIGDFILEGSIRAQAFADEEAEQADAERKRAAFAAFQNDPRIRAMREQEVARGE